MPERRKAASLTAIWSAFNRKSYRKPPAAEGYNRTDHQPLCVRVIPDEPKFTIRERLDSNNDYIDRWMHSKTSHLLLPPFHKIRTRVRTLSQSNSTLILQFWNLSHKTRRRVVLYRTIILFSNTIDTIKCTVRCPVTLINSVSALSEFKGKTYLPL